MFQDFFNYKIILFDKTVYNQNCIGLTEKVFLLSCRTWSGIKIIDQLEYKIWNIFPGLRIYAALRPECQMARIERSKIIVLVRFICWIMDSNDRSTGLSCFFRKQHAVYFINWIITYWYYWKVLFFSKCKIYWI